MSTASNGFSYNRVSIFGECRNRIKSMWDIIFGDKPKEWISFKPTLGAYVYPCYACQHLFSSFLSLQDHVNRRIIVLKYHCVDCKGNTLTFYNRCALLLHTRLHYSLKEGQINLSEVDTFTLPVDLAGFLPIPNIPQLYEKEEDELRGNIYINVQFYSPSEDQKGKATIVLKPNDFLFMNKSQPLCLKQVCRNVPKCKFITLSDQKKLKKRCLFEEENLDSNVKIELFDYVDQFTLPIISKVESLHEKAFNIPPCIECHSTEVSSMASHYQGDNKPADTKLTCETCKFVASTECSLKAHKRIHKNEPPHVCPDCGKDFDKSETLHKHLDEVCFHLAKNVKYRCPGKSCSKLFASMVNFSSHFKQHLKYSYMCSVCKAKLSCSSLLCIADMEKHIRYHNGNCTFSRVFDCGVCTDISSICESEYSKHFEMHTKIENISMYVYLCKHCPNFFRSKYTYATHILKCTNKMLDCQKRLGGGNKSSKVIITKKYFCILCNEQITLEKKVSHMKICKYANPVICVEKLDKLSKDHSYSVTVFPENNKRPKSPKYEENGKKKRKRFLTDINRRKRPEMQPDLIAEKPVEFDGTYYCKLCNFKSEERSEFHVHVRTHRNVSTAYQCMECGECFVVKPSLCKHLLHFHNISDCESYLIKNNCFDVVAVKELENVMRLAPGESKGPVKENQCRVCLEEFEDSVTLDKHFRTHGMAFLLKNSK